MLVCNKVSTALLKKNGIYRGKNSISGKPGQ